MSAGPPPAPPPPLSTKPPSHLRGHLQGDSSSRGKPRRHAVWKGNLRTPTPWSAMVLLRMAGSRLMHSDATPAARAGTTSSRERRHLTAVKTQWADCERESPPPIHPSAHTPRGRHTCLIGRMKRRFEQRRAELIKHRSARVAQNQGELGHNLKARRLGMVLAIQACSRSSTPGRRITRGLGRRVVRANDEPTIRTGCR